MAAPLILASWFVIFFLRLSCLLTHIITGVKATWPAGNSGAAVWFEPRNGVKGDLAIKLVNSTTLGNTIEPIYMVQDEQSSPIVGIGGIVALNSTAKLNLALLGSIRTIRDFSDSGQRVPDLFRDTVDWHQSTEGKVTLQRQWLDNETITTFTFEPSGLGNITLEDRVLFFEPGTYAWNATFNYPQLEQLSPEAVLNDGAYYLIDEKPIQVKALSFLSYTSKLLAGGWRFLTYFGRDSMISMLLMEPILSAGVNSSLEAGLAAVLERVDSGDGSVAHEETIGDYATYAHLQGGRASTEPEYDYSMVDTDYYLPIVLVEYLIKNPEGARRANEVLNTKVHETTVNAGFTYRQMAQRNAEKILSGASAFAEEPKKDNLIQLRSGHGTGEWRDSGNGLGGGRIPYDVNTALVPAGLRAIAALSVAGFFPDHPEWADLASNYAQVWEDKTLEFFRVDVKKNDAKSLLESYIVDNNFAFPPRSEFIENDIQFYGLALDGWDNQSIVRVMNSDDCFRHFLLNTTNQDQLTSFISQTADHILAPFPAGLLTEAGILVSNPAYGNATTYNQNFKNSDYHGTVVWGWQLSMMAKGLERQLGRCLGNSTTDERPDFCQNAPVYSKVIRAYNCLWDVIEANQDVLSNEVWSWQWINNAFSVLPLSSNGGVESNAIQLWSLTFLAVSRDHAIVS